MSEPVTIELEMPSDLEGLRFPAALDRRLQVLLDRQDEGLVLDDAERQEAEALVNLSEVLTALRLRATLANAGP